MTLIDPDITPEEFRHEIRHGIAPDVLSKLCDQVLTREPLAVLVANGMGNLTIVVGEETVGYIDIRGGESVEWN